jgi:hypothetical protein
MEKNNDMDAFIRDTLNSYQRIREKDRAPLQQTIVSRTSTNFGSGAPPLTLTSSNISSGSVVGGGGGSDIQFPFSITTKDSTFGSGVQPSFKVASYSSIMDGTNGGPFNITNLNKDISITSQKFIIAEADVPSNFIITGFTIKAVDAGETDEIVMTGSGETATQSKLRLLIGKVTAKTTDTGVKLTPWQAITTSYRTVNSFYNGVSVLVLEPAPTHQSRV